ncbi:CLIP-associating protein 2-like isoform X2 [Tetranychus urticae]|uniref:CLIP-associating protein 2-like isoform X2 n=1 Tax=Tetranychus urticae TaxID=32264 RepID=UPI00077C0534|nr:CLIP-associating protein 2-like isoform X2 [Tetranychus urticae]
METLLINYERKENVGKCSTESTLIEPLIGVGSSTSVNLVSGIKINNNHIFNSKHQDQEKQHLSSNGINKLLRKSVSLPLEPCTDEPDSSLNQTANDDTDTHRNSVNNKSSITMLRDKGYLNMATFTRNTGNGLSEYRDCYSDSNTPVKTISPGQLFNNHDNGLLTCQPAKFSSPTETSPQQSSLPTETETPPTTSELFHSRFNGSSFSPSPPLTSTPSINNCNSQSSSTRSMVNDHLSVSYLADHDVDSGPKSLPTFSSTLSSPSSGTSSTSLTNKESLYSGSGSIDDGLLTHNGSIVWDRESDWILLFDEMLKLKGTNRQGSEDCICRRKYSDSLRIKASQGISSPSSSSSTTSSLTPYDNDNMNGSKSSPLKRAASLPPSRRGVSPNIRIASQLVSHSPGAADEEMFIKSFEDVPMVHFGSLKELDDELNRIKEWLGEKNSDWTKRIDGLKRLRSVLMSTSTDLKEFLEWFKGLELSFIPCVKDLRSQVVRETCFTIGYISQKLGLKATRFCEMLLPILISLIPNSAKIMSSSATVAIRFIIQYTRSPRLIPVITYNMNSKSKEIRKACCEFLDQILHTWPTSGLDKHGLALQEAIKKGISDADPEARQFARKAFWGFADHFRDAADALLHSLDPSKQRILHGEAAYQQHTLTSSPSHSGVLSKNSSRSNSGSTGSLSQPDGPFNENNNCKVSPFLFSSSLPSSSSLITPVIRKVSTGSSSTTSSASSSPLNHTKVPVAKSSTQNQSEAQSRSSNRQLQPTSYLPRIRCNLNKYSLSSSPSSTSSGSSGSYLNSPLRSSSAIDTDAARRARTRATTISSTLSRVNKSPLNGSNDVNGRKKVPTPTSNGTKDSGRFSSDTRHRYSVRSSQSQPSSRSASPLSRGLVNGSPVKSNETPESRPIQIRRNSGIPVSANSRESSPSRNGKQPNELSSSYTNGTNGNSNHPSNGHFTRSLSSDSYTLKGKLLQSNKEVDLSMAHTLKNLNNVQRNRFAHDDQSDNESETSSVTSDFSFAARNIEEVSDIICNLSSSQWMDRKEGLLDLNLFLQLGPRSLNQFELKRITEIFNKMLMDPHIKNHSLLFKALNNLITSHKNHLYDWLYLLMTRLFMKIGSVGLASLTAKVNKTLDTIFVSFPVDNQFSCLARFLSDQSQTLNEKSKLRVISYINRLISKMVPVDCYSPDKHDLQLSLMKIISWTNDPKSSELRRQSKEALINLFTLNRQRIYTIVYQLPKSYQDTAFTLIHSRKRPSDDKSCFTSSAVLAPSASLLQDSSMFMSLNIRNGSTFESTFDETENLNPDEIYHSLLRTTDEIQKYKFNGGVDDDLDERLTSSLIYNRNSSFASAPSSSPSSPSSSTSKTPSSSSSSTSNKSTNNVVSSSNLINGSQSKSLSSKTSRSNGKKSEILHDKRNSNNNNYINGYHRQTTNGIEGKIVKNHHLITPLTVDTKPNNSTILLRSDESTINRANQSNLSANNDHFHHHHYHHNHHPNSNGHSSPTKNGHETVTNNLISSLKNGHSKDNDYQKYALNELIELIKDSKLDLSRHFRDMLKILLDKMADEGNPTVRQLALRILRELLLKQPSLFSDYTELTVLRVLNASKDTDKEVQRISDLVSATAASVLPADSCLKILKSAMNSGDGATSQAAIKMLSKFIERQDEDQIEALLPDIMPSLIQACDNRESSIRKSAIFTLVAIYNRIGDRLNPHIANLNGSKLKLLKLYIERAQASGTNGSEYSFS